MADLLEWASHPSVIGAASLIAAFAAIITAMATTYPAYILWKSRRRGISTEWSKENGETCFAVICELTNDLGATLEGVSVKVTGPVANVDEGATARPKHFSWARNKCPIHVTVSPGESGRFVVRIHPDAQALKNHRATSRRHPRYLLGWMLWKLFDWELPFGPAFLLRCKLRTRSSSIRPVFLNHKVRINAFMAQRMAATIEKNGASE